MSDSARTWLAEVLGTFVLVLIGGLSILATGGSNVVAISFGFGLALLAGLYAFGEISGGHFNPAVSLGALIDGRITVERFIQYVISQSGGAVLAGIVLLVAADQTAVASTTTQPAPGVGAGSAFLLEILLTAIFVAVILKVTTSELSGMTAFAAIALTLTAIHLGAAAITGASVNPARSLGSALVGGEFSDFWIYVTAPFIGAGLGWGMFKVATTGGFGERSLE
ncbi:MAG: MIP/aquaporin family protein [Acidimicrobiia bacterium]